MKSLILFASLVLFVSLSWGYPEGAPCEVMQSMQPSVVSHGLESQNTTLASQGYKLKIFESTDLTERSISEYEENGMYTIRLTGGPFKGFMMQVRPLDESLEVAADKRLGKFQRDPLWKSQGIKFMKCDDEKSHETITHSDAFDREVLQVKWKPVSSVTPVQVLVTIVEKKKRYWTAAALPGGFLKPRSEIRRRPVETNSPDDFFGAALDDFFQVKQEDVVQPTTGSALKNTTLLVPIGTTATDVQYSSEPPTTIPPQTKSGIASTITVPQQRLQTLFAGIAAENPSEQSNATLVRGEVEVPQFDPTSVEGLSHVSAPQWHSSKEMSSGNAAGLLNESSLKEAIQPAVVVVQKAPVSEEHQPELTTRFPTTTVRATTRRSRVIAADFRPDDRNIRPTLVESGVSNPCDREDYWAICPSWQEHCEMDHVRLNCPYTCGCPRSRQQIN